MIKTFFRSRENKNLCFVGLLFLVMAIVLFTRGPIADKESFHNFADQRMLCGLPHFWNVFTNLPFLIFGGMGLYHTLKNAKRLGDSLYAWTFFFSGVCLVFLGSSFYHLDPTTYRLLWDRLPMTLGFMGLFSAFMQEFAHSKFCRFFLIPLILLGLFSVLLWYFTNDLRLYIIIQGGPILALLIFTFVLKGDWKSKSFYLLGLGLYILAKACESNDQRLYEVLGMSGHAIKHVLASLSALAFSEKIRRHI